MGPLAKMHCTWILAYFFFLARVRSSFPTRGSTTPVPSDAASLGKGIVCYTRYRVRIGWERWYGCCGEVYQVCGR